MVTKTIPAPGTIERMFMGVERVKEQLARAVAALEAGGVKYAVVGGNAVANWVTRIDRGAERFTRDVDIMVRRSDLPAVIAAMAPAGFEYVEVNGVDRFIDGPDGMPSEGVHLLFAGEMLRFDDLAPVPGMDESERSASFRVVSLEALVRMKLTSYRRKDQTHLVDLMHVGLVDRSWLTRFTPQLAERLRELLDDPNEHRGRV